MFKAEDAYARNHKALDVDLYIGAGGGEADEWFTAVGGIISSTARLAETLNMRGYEGLSMKSRFYTDEDHYTVVPRLVGDGIRHLWRDEIRKLGSSWPVRPRS